MNLTNPLPQDVVDYVTKEQPHLLLLVLKHAKPYMAAIEERVKQLDHGQIEATLHVRAGEVEKMEFHEHKVWLRAKS